MDAKIKPKFNLIQKFGATIILLGLFCVLIPNIIGNIATNITSLFMIILGLLGALLAVSHKNIIDLFLHVLIMVLGILSFAYFYDIFIYFGLIFIIYGVLALLVLYRKEYKSMAKTIAISIFLFALGLLMLIFTFDQNIVTLGAFIMIGGLLLLNETRDIDLKQITNSSTIFHFDVYGEQEKSKDYTSFSANYSNDIECLNKQFIKDKDAEEVEFEEVDIDFEKIQK